MFTGLVFKAEHDALRSRWDVVCHKLTFHGYSDELSHEIKELMNDTDDLQRRVNEELKRLGIEK